MTAVEPTRQRTIACSRVAVVWFSTLENFLPQPADAGRYALLARRQPKRRNEMGTKIEVLEGESIHSALKRLQTQLDHGVSRSWYKSRVGYYEKPSIKQRRKRRIAWINKRCDATTTRTLKMKMGFKWLYERKRPWP